MPAVGNTLVVACKSFGARVRCINASGRFSAQVGTQAVDIGLMRPAPRSHHVFSSRYRLCKDDDRRAIGHYGQAITLNWKELS